MKRTALYLLVLAMAAALKPDASEIGMLQPVELVYVYREDEQIIVETDTGDLGRGMTMRDAIANLKDTTPGIVYLDTADYALYHTAARGLIPETREFLKPDVRICLTDGGICPEEAARYLEAHRPGTRLEEWRDNLPLEMLTVDGDKMKKTDKKCLTNNIEYARIPKLSVGRRGMEAGTKKFEKT